MALGHLERFKLRCSQVGRTITLYPFSAHATGAYVDAWSGHPDPDSASYPTGSQPGPTYGTGVTLSAMVQPLGTQDGGEQFIVLPSGERKAIDLVTYIPGDQAVTSEDKITVGSNTYWIGGLKEEYVGSTRVHWKVQLIDSVARNT